MILVGELAAIDYVMFTRITHALAPRVRIVVLAETLVPAQVEAAYAAGAADYLPWDVYADDLLEAIESACLRQARFERGAASVAAAPDAWIRTEV